MKRRKSTMLLAIGIIALIAGIYAVGAIMPDANLYADFHRKGLPPSIEHPFGTDLLGRDMLTRTMKGLSLSLFVGLASSGAAALIALVLGVLAAFGGGWVDHLINWLIDLFMGIPHTLLLILISIAAGRGWRGLMIGMIFTHWPSLARIIRGEVSQIRSSHYIAASQKLGRSNWWVMSRHIFPHMVPQLLMGLVLLFPHAIMHESGLTFLGFGLPPEQPAIGIILAESMRHLSSGMWWLSIFPGLALASMVLLIDGLGECIKLLQDPKTAQG